MFSVLIRPAGTLQSEFRAALADRTKQRVRLQAHAFGALRSAVAAVVIFIARSGAGS